VDEFAHPAWSRGHDLRVLDRIKDRPTREWYLRAALEFGWSQEVLVLQIESWLYERVGKALTYFQWALPSPESDLAEQILKDPYNFDFLTVTATAKEREIERGLLTHLRDLLLELGRGFSFVGIQVPLSVDGQTFYMGNAQGVFPVGEAHVFFIAFHSKCWQIRQTFYTSLPPKKEPRARLNGRFFPMRPKPLFAILLAASDNLSRGAHGSELS
jgi:predicted nuclease of restriction endonuclease-like (RecB) superfamily